MQKLLKLKLKSSSLYKETNNSRNLSPCYGGCASRETRSNQHPSVGSRGRVLVVQIIDITWFRRKVYWLPTKTSLIPPIDIFLAL